MPDTIFRNEKIEILKQEKTYELKTLSVGMSIEAFSSLLSQKFPYIEVASALQVKAALGTAPSGPVLLGNARERVKIRVSEDRLAAYLTLWVEPEQIDATYRVELIREIGAELRKNGISYGVHTAKLGGHLEIGKELCIAEGVPPVPGKDAEVKMIDLSAPVPEVIEDGAANHYEMNLILRVTKGDWLGERLDPVPGKAGTDIHGRLVPPIPGVMIPLRFDRVSVAEEVLDGKTILRSKKSGAVYYRGDAVGVYDFLEVKGDVNFSTGNLDFDGFLSVKGTVEDQFSVAADHDIEILGEYGVGGANEIVSREGNIFIRGGIAGKGKAVVRCKKNLYVKFLSDVTVECEGNVYVGFYAINSYIKARQVIVESPRGRIVGGKIQAEIRIETAELGNRSETRTIAVVSGFNRKKLKSDFEHILRAMEAGKTEMGRLKQRLQIYDETNQTPKQRMEQAAIRDELDGLRESLKKVEYEYKALADHLRTPGEGSIYVKKRCYAKVRIEITNMAIEMKDECGSRTFVSREGELVET